MKMFLRLLDPLPKLCQLDHCCRLLLLLKQCLGFFLLNLSLGAPSLIAYFTKVMRLTFADYSRIWITDEDEK